eukprot:2933947-Rhodomonas_salina.2
MIGSKTFFRQAAPLTRATSPMTPTSVTALADALSLYLVPGSHSAMRCGINAACGGSRGNYGATTSYVAETDAEVLVIERMVSP